MYNLYLFEEFLNQFSPLIREIETIHDCLHSVQRNANSVKFKTIDADKMKQRLHEIECELRLKPEELIEISDEDTV